MEQNGQTNTGFTPEMNPASQVQLPMGHSPQGVTAPQAPQAPQQVPDTGMGMHKLADKIQQILTLFYFFVASVLLLRFVFSLFGANRQSPFADFVYQITTPFMFLFEGMFGGGVGVGDYQLEPEIFVALIVYALIFFGLARLVKILLK